MKRKSFCAFGLVFWLIAFSTIFSFGVERWMTPVVVAVGTDMRGLIPLDCLQWEEDGPHLYQIEEGSNWSSGTRAAEVPPDSYQVMENGVHPTYGYGLKFVQYSTKLILEGGLVTTESGKMGPGPDVWLIVPQDGGAPSLRPVESAVRPFMEGRLKQELEAEKIYSLFETQEFFSALVPLAVVPAGVLFCLILWVAICFLAKAPRQNRKKIFLNAGMMAVFLAALPLLCSLIRLPSSLLPRANLLDFPHYQAEFSEIFTALAAFAENGDGTAQALLRHAPSMLWAAAGVLLAGLVLGGCAALLELRRPKRQKFVPRHAAPRR